MIKQVIRFKSIGEIFLFSIFLFSFFSFQGFIPCAKYIFSIPLTILLKGNCSLMLCRNFCSSIQPRNSSFSLHHAWSHIVLPHLLARCYSVHIMATHYLLLRKSKSCYVLNTVIIKKYFFLLGIYVTYYVGEKRLHQSSLDFYYSLLVDIVSIIYNLSLMILKV